MRYVRRGGAYLRVADPDWRDPLDAVYARERGGRWNPPGSFGVVYLSRDLVVARANVARKYAGRPYDPQFFNPDSAPVLIETSVVDEDYVDILTDDGCRAVGLPASYPRDTNGTLVAHDRCQPIGALAWAAGNAGVACRSAAPGMTREREELAWFEREGRDRLTVVRRLRFDEWFWA